jgi:hypothetical protein
MRSGKRRWQIAEMLYSEWLREFGIVHWKPDLLPGFSAGDLNCTFGLADGDST